MALPCGVTLTIDLLANACKCHTYAFACISNSGAPVMADLTLVSYDLCPFVQRAAIALAEKGVDFRRVDRKSTRLISSHLVISYAVFCLKKKKKKNINQKKKKKKLKNIQ